MNKLIKNHITEYTRILYLEAFDIQLYAQNASFETALQKLLDERAEELSADLAHTRLAVREMLRFGGYKPTGRAKPAPEYLLRATQNNAFPRINAAVDICNFLSLKYMLPVSLWDLDLSETSQYVFRYGKENESYIFNTGGQEIGLEDLICGFGVFNDEERPMVNPIKDSLRTKTTPETRNIGSVVYLPRGFKDAEKVLTEYHKALEHIASKVNSCII